MNIEKLEKEFEGKGEVKGCHFSLHGESEKAYIYSILNEDTIYFEVFQKRITAKCISFDEKIYSETEFKEQYPKSIDFGVWAWTFRDLAKALQKFESL